MVQGQRTQTKSLVIMQSLPQTPSETDSLHSAMEMFTAWYHLSDFSNIYCVNKNEEVNKTDLSYIEN